MLNNGYVRDYVEDADKPILAGQTDRPLAGRPRRWSSTPRSGKWLIALGEKAFGMDPFGWRIAAAVVGSLMVLVMCRFVRRRHRLHRCSAASAGCCSASTACTSCCPGWRCSTSSSRSSCSARSTASSPTATGSGAGWPRPPTSTTGRSPRPAVGPGARPALPAVAARRRASCFGLAVGTKWTALFPLAAFGILVLGLERRRPPVVRGALARAPLGAHRRRAGLRPPGRRRPRRLRRHLDRLARARRGVRGAPLRHAVHDVRRRQALADRHRARRRGPRRGRPVAALAVVLPPGRLRVPHPLPQRQRPRLRVQARRAGC